MSFQFFCVLDWDLLNNVGYLRLHWLNKPKGPYKEGEEVIDELSIQLPALVKLVEHELDIISHLNDYNN